MNETAYKSNRNRHTQYTTVTITPTIRAFDMYSAIKCLFTDDVTYYVISRVDSCKCSISHNNAWKCICIFRTI